MIRKHVARMLAFTSAVCWAGSLHGEESVQELPPRQEERLPRSVDEIAAMIDAGSIDEAGRALELAYIAATSHREASPRSRRELVDLWQRVSQEGTNATVSAARCRERLLLGLVECDESAAPQFFNAYFQLDRVVVGAYRQPELFEFLVSADEKKAARVFPVVMYDLVDEGYYNLTLEYLVPSEAWERCMLIRSYYLKAQKLNPDRFPSWVGIGPRDSFVRDVLVLIGLLAYGERDEEAAKYAGMLRQEIGKLSAEEEERLESALSGVVPERRSSR